MNNSDNPLLAEWQSPYGLPPFDRIRPEHFGPALDAAMAEHDAEVASLAASAAPPSFANTIEALDRSGATLSRVAAAFDNLCSSMTSEALQAVEREYAPKLSLHAARLRLDGALFARVDAVHRTRESAGLDRLQIRLTEKIHLDFVLAGARLDEAGKKRAAQLVEALSAKCTAFGQAVLADEEETFVLIETAAGLEGLPPGLVSAAAEAAKARGHAGAWAITLSRSFVEPFLTASRRRELRRKVWEAFKARGELRADRDTKPLIKEILGLRAEQARLLGYASYADYALVSRMAKKPQAVADLLDAVWAPALAKARAEEALLTRLATESDGIEKLEAWDWLYYADQVKRRDYALDDEEVKPYFSLDAMVRAMFWAAGRLFGLDFVEIKGVPLYHPDVRLFELRDRADGKLRGIFLHDNYSRAGKRSGAWMSNYREQSAGAIPIVVNNNNFTPGAPGEKVLISFDDASTLFHEFGHGLHGLLSEVDYQGLSGTNVLRDFVELPSQLFEHWALAPELLEKFAVHVDTGRPIPPELVARIRRARTCNMGWETLQYLGPALLDMALHSMPGYASLDAAEFEARECERMGLPPVVGLRHRLPHFQHLFSGESYAAGYYVYLWAEVLEADAFSAFEERGDLFDPELAARLRRCIYSAGNSQEPAEAFRAFRGRDPDIQALLKQRGLA
jgi:peptidyl-dipeptidase Dcp